MSVGALFGTVITHDSTSEPWAFVAWMVTVSGLYWMLAVQETCPLPELKPKPGGCGEGATRVHVLIGAPASTVGVWL